jgi:anti-anti-sigma factor
MAARHHQPALTVLTTWRMHDAVVTTCGDIDITTTGQLTHRLRQVLGIRPRQLTIDLSGTRYIDAAGCRVLARTALTLPPGQTLTLRSPSPIARRIFQLTGLDELCRIEPAASPHTTRANPADPLSMRAPAHASAVRPA